MEIKYLTEQAQAKYVKEILDEYSAECTTTDALLIGRRIADRVNELADIGRRLDTLKDEIEEIYDKYTDTLNKLGKIKAFKNSEVGRLIKCFCKTQDKSILTEIERTISQDNPWGIEIYTQERIYSIIKNSKSELCYGFIRKPHFALENIGYYLFDNFNIDEDISEGTSLLQHYEKKCADAMSAIADIEQHVNSVERYDTAIWDAADKLDIDLSEWY